MAVNEIKLILIYANYCNVLYRPTLQQTHSETVTLCRLMRQILSVRPPFVCGGLANF